MPTKDGSTHQETPFPDGGNKFALVVGVNDSSIVVPYRSTLKYAEKDAEDMGYLLKQPECNFTLLESILTGERATSGNIKQKVIRLVKKRTEHDFLLFYYAGHAVPIHDDIYFVTHEFQEDNVQIDPDLHLSMRWLWKVLYQSVGAGRVLLILDCCFAGNMVETKEDPLKLDLRRLLEEWNTGSSGKDQRNCLRLVLTATGYNIQAQELEGQGLMTGLLLKALRGEVEEVLDREGHIDIRFLHRYLQNKMPKEQQPDLSGKFGPYNCILASHPHRSERLRQQVRENEIKHEVERGILSELYRLYAETQHTQPFDHAVCHSASLEDLDEEKIAEFLKRERTQQDEAFLPDVSTQEQLIQFGFLQKLLPTYGALLCFSRTPSKWVAGAITRCIDWGGNPNLDQMQDSREYRDSLLKQYEFSLNFLKKRLRLSKVISHGGREERWEIPQAVIEEALANALVHREYTNRTDPVRIEVFNDRIEICSPGTLPPPMTKELLHLKHNSYPRNPQIAGIFYLHGYIEKLGAGIQRMQRFMKDEGLAEPEFKLGEDQTFTVVLHRPKYISSSLLRVDWGEAPEMEIGNFYGREKELDKLRVQVLHDRCRLVAVLGIGGIGKTQLVRAFVEGNEHEFEYVFWRSLQNAPSLEKILRECIQFVSGQNQTDLPGDEEEQISLLLHFLQDRRCLLIFDNVESILQSTRYSGKYREGYEGYGQLFLQIGQQRHQSCLLLTSREEPKEVARLEGQKAHAFRLSGLDIAAIKKILKDSGLPNMQDSAASELITRYSGNPLALKLAAWQIRDVYLGNLTEFLQEEKMLIEGIENVLDEHFQRLTAPEQAIMYWLAIERRPISLRELRENLVDPAQINAAARTVTSLLARSMIESDSRAGNFSLQPVILEYTTNRFVAQICQELEAETIRLFASHALMKAQSRDNIRESQVRLLLMPVAQQFLQKGRVALAEKCKRILEQLRATSTEQAGYTAGNVLNLLVQLKYDLRGYDFSYLTVRQAHLQGVLLHGVNFSHTTVTASSFTDTFGGVLSVTFSPGKGQLLAAGTVNNEIRVWHTASGTPACTCQGHTGWVTSVIFSPDGRVIASGSEDETVRLWEVESGKCLQILQVHSGVISSLSFSPDGAILASGSHDKTIRLWNMQTSGEPPRILQGHDEVVWSITFSPDGKMLASSGEDRTIRIWSTENGQLLKILKEDVGRVYSVVFSPDGKILASGGDDNQVHLWDIESEKHLKILAGHTDWIWSIAFSPDGKTLVSGGDDQKMCFWDIESGKCFRTLQVHSSTVRSVAFSPDGKVMASGSDDQTIRLWDSSNGDCIQTLQGYRNSMTSVAFNPDGKTLASGSEDRIVRLWDIVSGGSEALSALTDRIWSVAFNASGTMLAGSAVEVSVWEMGNKRWVKTFPHSTWVYSVAFSPDGKFLGTGDDDGTVYLWDISNDSSQRPKILRKGSYSHWSVAFSPADGIIAASSEEAIDIWDIDRGEHLRSLQDHTKIVRSIAFSPDGAILVSGSEDCTVRVWLTHTGSRLKILEGHTGPVYTVAISLDGRMVASGSHDKTIRLWNMQENGEPPRALQGHEDIVWCVAFHPDGGILASASQDGTIRLWNTQTGECFHILRIDRPYEGMNITEIIGLTSAQKMTLRALGAIEEVG